MIRLINQGNYLLTETFDHTRILALDNTQRYAWINAGEIGEILIHTSKKFNPAYIIAAGPYRLYDVKGEAELTDLLHLELFAGNGIWQGYILPTGLPTENDKRNRIIATDEVITRTTH